MKTLFLVALIGLTLGSPASACGPSGGTLVLGIGILVGVLVLIAGVQREAYAAARDFMRGVTPDRGAPYWLGLGILMDCGVFALWLASDLAAVFGCYLLLAGLPKLLMTLAGISREAGAAHAARAQY